MSQLQSVLRRSVAHLDPSDHDGRERVFVNAREAMIRLLWSYDPPLSPKEIDSKIDEFDDIVAGILDGEADEDAEDDADLEAPDTVDAAAAEAVFDAAPPPPPEAPAMSERRAEALAILRRPARFEPLLQIGSPTPSALPDKADAAPSARPAPAAASSESALLAKQAVEQALARLNSRIAPVDEDEVAGQDDDRRVSDDEIDNLPDGDDGDATDDDAEPGEDQDDPTPDEDRDGHRSLDEAEYDDDDTDDPDLADPDLDDPDQSDLEPDAEDVDADERDARDDDEFTEVDEDDRETEARLRPARQRFIDDDEDAEAIDDDTQDRPPLGERLRDAIGGISGRTLAAIAAGVVLLSGLGLGTAYFVGRDGEPPMTAAAPEQPASTAAAPATPPESTPPASAAAPDPAPAPIPSGGLALETLSLFDGRDPSVFQSAPGNPIRFEGDTQGGFARIASTTNGAGSRITVGRGVFERLAGRTVRIVVVARAAVTDPASSLRFSYQNGRSLSPWQDSALGADYAPLSLTWNVPKERGGPETDAVMIEPGIPGDGTAADVSSVRIEILK
jgi:hypothetical protein